MRCRSKTAHQEKLQLTDCREIVQIEFLKPVHNRPRTFNTSDIARGIGTQFEVEVSTTIEDFLLAYAKDPYSMSDNGLVPFGRLL